MSLKQLAKILRRARSEMPRRTSVDAYAQMDELMGTTKTSTVPKSSGPRSVPGRKSVA